MYNGQIKIENGRFVVYIDDYKEFIRLSTRYSPKTPNVGIIKKINGHDVVVEAYFVAGLRHSESICYKFVADELHLDNLTKNLKKIKHSN